MESKIIQLRKTNFSTKNLEKEPYISKSHLKNLILLKTKLFHKKKIEQKVNPLLENTSLNKKVGKKVRRIILARKVQLQLRKKIKKQLQQKIGLKGRRKLQDKVLKNVLPYIWSTNFWKKGLKARSFLKKIEKRDQTFSWMQKFRFAVSKTRFSRANLFFLTTFLKKRKKNRKLNNVRKNKTFFSESLFFQERKRLKLFLKKNRNFLQKHPVHKNFVFRKHKFLKNNSMGLNKKNKLSNPEQFLGKKKRIVRKIYVRKLLKLKRKKNRKISISKKKKKLQKLLKARKKKKGKKKHKLLRAIKRFFKRKFWRIKRKNYNKYKTRKNKLRYTKKGKLKKRSFHIYKWHQLLRPSIRQYRFQKRVLSEFNASPAQKYPHKELVKKRVYFLKKAGIKKYQVLLSGKQLFSKINFWWTAKSKEFKDEKVLNWRKIFRLTNFSGLKRKNYTLKKLTKTRYLMKKKNKLPILIRSFPKKIKESFRKKNLVLKKNTKKKIGMKPSIQIRKKFLIKNIKSLVLIKKNKVVVPEKYKAPRISTKTTFLRKSTLDQFSNPLQKRFFSSLALKFVEQKKVKKGRRRRKKKRFKKLLQKLFLKKDFLRRKNKPLKKKQFSTKTKSQVSKPKKPFLKKKNQARATLGFRATSYLKKKSRRFSKLFFKKYKKTFNKKLFSTLLQETSLKEKRRKTKFLVQQKARRFRRRGHRNWNYRLPRFRKYYRYLWKYNGTDQRNKWLRSELYSFKEYRKVHQIFRKKDPRKTKKNGWLRRLSYATQLHKPVSRKDRLISRLMYFKLFSKFYGPFTIKKLANWSRHFQRIQPKLGGGKLMPLYWFDRRLDVTVFRFGLAPSLKVARILVARGYIFVNGHQILNVEHRVSTWDIVSITPYEWLEFPYQYYWFIRCEYKLYLYKKKKARLRSVHPQKLTYPFGFWTHQHQDIDLRSREQIPEKEFEKTLLSRYGRRWI